MTDAIAAISTTTVVSPRPRKRAAEHRADFRLTFIGGLDGQRGAGWKCCFDRSLALFDRDPGLERDRQLRRRLVLPHSLAWSLLFMTIAPDSQP